MYGIQAIWHMVLVVSDLVRTGEALLIGIMMDPIYFSSTVMLDFVKLR